MITTPNSHWSRTELPTFTVMSIQVQFLTTPEQISSDVSIMRTIVPPSMTVPLHRHADPEIFYLLEGCLEVFQEGDGHGEWRTFQPGEIVSIAGNIKHATRNTSKAPVVCLVITKTELYSFLWDLAQPLTEDTPIGPPTSAEMRTLFAMAERYRYWLATPQENAAIGIFLEEAPEAHGVKNENR